MKTVWGDNYQKFKWSMWEPSSSYSQIMVYGSLGEEKSQPLEKELKVK